MIKYIPVLLTILFTVYGQVILKWRMSMKNELPDGVIDKLQFLLKAYLDPWIISGFISAFVASFFWMVAVKNLELSKAYPLMSISFLLVFIAGIFLFHESHTLNNWVGLLLIIFGICIFSYS